MPVPLGPGDHLELLAYYCGRYYGPSQFLQPSRKLVMIGSCAITKVDQYRHLNGGQIPETQAPLVPEPAPLEDGIGTCTRGFRPTLEEAARLAAIPVPRKGDIFVTLQSCKAYTRPTHGKYIVSLSPNKRLVVLSAAVVSFPNENEGQSMWGIAICTRDPRHGRDRRKGSPTFCHGKVWVNVTRGEQNFAFIRS